MCKGVLSGCVSQLQREAPVLLLIPNLDRLVDSYPAFLLTLQKNQSPHRKGTFWIPLSTGAILHLLSGTQ